MNTARSRIANRVLDWADSTIHALHLDATTIGRKVCDAHEVAVTADPQETPHP